MLTLSLLILVLLTAHTAHAARKPASEQAWQYRYKVWMPAVWQRLAQCESGSNPPNWRHDSGGYSGAFGFANSSWAQYRYDGYPWRASRATPFQQYRVALRIHKHFGFSGWGCYQGTQHEWVRTG